MNTCDVWNGARSATLAALLFGLVSPSLAEGNIFLRLSAGEEYLINGQETQFPQKSRGEAATGAAEVATLPVLTLEKLLQAAVATNPTLASSRMEAKAAAHEITVAERLRWPTVSIMAESDTGSPYQQPSRALRLDQVLWDFGGISSRIDVAERASSAADVSVNQQTEQIFLSVVSAWQALLNARERLAVGVNAKSLLLNYSNQMQRRVEARISPAIDRGLVESRLLQTEVEIMAAKTTIRTNTLRLAQLTGISNIEMRLPSSAIPNSAFLEAIVRTVLSMNVGSLVDKHPAVLKAQADVATARSRLSAKEAERWPQIYARVDQPLGTTHYNNNQEAKAFLGLRYAPGAGFQFAEVDALESKVGALEKTVEAARLELQGAFLSDKEELLSARERIRSLEEAVSLSDNVLDSYLRQFQAGKKSWLDLLNTVREQAQNQYALADVKASMAATAYRLAVRMGTPLF